MKKFPLVVVRKYLPPAIYVEKKKLPKPKIQELCQIWIRKNF